MPNTTVKTHEGLVADWHEYAKSHDDDNYRFLRRLKQQSSFTKVDRIALELHQEAFGIVDCTKCANCCRTLRIVMNDEDITRISAHLGLERDAFIAAYLESSDEEGWYRIKTTPCPFLGGDNKCTIYDVRPEKCRGYSFTDKPDFLFHTFTHANNAVVCPAVFYLVEQMKRRMGR
jgi:Fe-S-cluster containining protein